MAPRRIGNQGCKPYKNGYGPASHCSIDPELLRRVGMERDGVFHASISANEITSEHPAKWLALHIRDVDPSLPTPVDGLIYYVGAVTIWYSTNDLPVWTGSHI
ncbi:hypothetical protein ACVWZR_005360 [Bradyrhizobium sp. i1.3.1]